MNIIAFDLLSLFHLNLDKKLTYQLKFKAKKALLRLFCLMALFSFLGLEIQQSINQDEFIEWTENTDSEEDNKEEEKKGEEIDDYLVAEINYSIYSNHYIHHWLNHQMKWENLLDEILMEPPELRCQLT